VSRAPTRLVGLILAGGRSSRMGPGPPKPCLEIGARSMIGRVADRLAPYVDELVIATDRPDLYGDLGGLCVCDAVPGYAGPLAGLQAAANHLQAAANRDLRLVTAPADTPFLPADFAPRLLDGATLGGLRVATSFGRWHPACATWPPTAIDHLASLTLDATRAPSLRSVMATYAIEEVAFPMSLAAPGGDPFFNVNTPQDLATARDFAVSRG
jgi:molybdopterin-guanine dinucleotide biosynthesis protein A